MVLLNKSEAHLSLTTGMWFDLAKDKSWTEVITLLWPPGSAGQPSLHVAPTPAGKVQSSAHDSCSSGLLLFLPQWRTSHKRFGNCVMLDYITWVQTRSLWVTRRSHHSSYSCSSSQVWKKRWLNKSMNTFLPSLGLGFHDSWRKSV